MSLTLMLSPKNSVTFFNPSPNIIVNGNAYAGGMVMAAAGDVAALTAAGYVTPVFSGLSASNVGPTVARPMPTNVAAGTIYIDATLNAVVASDGANWRSVATGAIS